ncbi:hypothetical protein AAU61_18020 [Desulfocarbo indianensis]|nr:hypothetical protein AAU61_18020 [Desulfocarbo indianensis]
MNRSTGWAKGMALAMAAVGLLTLWRPGQAAAPHEENSVLEAAQVLAPALRSGPGFRVEAKVANDGWLNFYRVESDYGHFTAMGGLALQKLAGEIKAIAAMAKVEQGDTFGKSLGESAKRAGKGIKNLFTDPGGTMEGAATGLGRLFDRVNESLSGSGPGQSEDSRAKQFIGFSKAKRETAAKFGVDVYSANRVLQEQLDRLAWADYAGGITVGAASAVVPAGAGLVVSTAGGARLLNDVIRTTPPSELRMMNRQKLNAMAMPADLSEVFVENQVYSLREQTIVVAALEAMPKLKNRRLMIKAALQAQRREMSFLLSTMAAMYAGFYRQVRPLAELKPIGRLLYAVDGQGAPVVTLPADHVLWSSRLARAVDEIKRQTGGKAGELWVTGDLSPRAAAELKIAGWKIRTNCAEKLLGKSQPPA